MLTATKLLLHIYNTQGPRGKGGKVVPFRKYAAMTLKHVNTTWDFDGRILMHEIATVLARKPRRRKARTTV